MIYNYGLFRRNVDNFSFIIDIKSIYGTGDKKASYMIMRQTWAWISLCISSRISAFVNFY